MAQAGSSRMGSGTGDMISDTRVGAQPLALNQTASSRIDNSTDIDVFKISLTAGATYTVKMGFGTKALDMVQAGILYVESEAGFKRNVYLTDPNQYDTARPQGGENTYSFVAPASGDYYVSWMADYYTPRTYDGAYTLTMSETRDDFGATNAGAGTLQVGGTASGTMEQWLTGDVDRFAIDLQAGTRYWLGLENGPTNPWSGWTAGLAIYDAGGNLLGKRAEEVYNSKMTLPFTPTATGTYYVDVSQVERVSNGDIRYMLSASPAGVDDAGDSISTATLVGPGGKFEGKLEQDTDVDVFRLPVVAGESYFVGLGGPPGTKSFTILEKDSVPAYRLYAPADNYQDHSILTPSRTGDIYFAVTGGEWRADTSMYTLLASQVPKDDLGNTRDRAGTLAVGSQFKGKLDYSGDTDWIKVRLEAGTAYLFDAWKEPTGTALGSYGPLISLYDQAGNGLGHIGDTSSPLNHYTARVSGDYFIEVGAGIAGYGIQVSSWQGDGAGPALLSTQVTRVAGGVMPNTGFQLRFNEKLSFAGQGSTSIILNDQNGHEVQRWNQSDWKFDGHTLTLAPAKLLGFGQQYTLQLGADSVRDLANAASAASTFTFQTVAGAASGGNGNDYLTGTGKGNSINGGAGIDTVFYPGKRADFAVTALADSHKVAGPSSSSADLLAGVERLQFLDSAIALDINGAAGQGYRLYRAAFDRTPDQAGVGYWMAQLDQGAALRDVAASFIASSEFVMRYGSAPWLTDEMFAYRLYTNVLHRTPDQAGIDYWIDTLAKGISRADVLVSFSESPENKAAVADIIGNGFEYVPYS